MIAVLFSLSWGIDLIPGWGTVDACLVGQAAMEWGGEDNTDVCIEPIKSNDDINVSL